MSQDVAAVRINLRDALALLGRALNYVGVDDVYHGHRVAYMAYSCAEMLGWDYSACQFVLRAGLLHDCGVSTTAAHAKLIAAVTPEDTQPHCDRGWQRLRACAPLSELAEAVRWHHTPWPDMRHRPLDKLSKNAAALIFLADRVDVMRAMAIENRTPDAVVMQKQTIARALDDMAGNLFQPDYVAVLQQLIDRDGFWYMQDAQYIESHLLSLMQGSDYEHCLPAAATLALADFLAKIIDAKSPLTYQHSQRVAMIAYALSADLALPESVCEQIQIAGLLHDIGKLRIPDAILEKPGVLDQQERSIIKRHTIDTRQALGSFFQQSRLPEWAANHHEKLDGSGYPYCLSADALDLPSRIIAVADIFQALAQNRPYHERRDAQHILQLMQAMAQEAKIDAAVLQKIQQRSAHYYQLATVETAAAG